MQLSEIEAIQEIIVHDNCPDGLASAILLHDAIPSAQIRFMQYGTAEYAALRAAPGQLFADFSPSADRAQEFIDAGAWILDHHKTAKDVVARFGERGVFGDEVTAPGVCGAVLCYQHVWVPVRMQHPGGLIWELEATHRFAMLAGVRDTWQRQSPYWEEACKQADTLMFMPREQWLKIELTDLVRDWNERFGWVGDVLAEKTVKSIAKTVKGSRRVQTAKGTRLVIFQGTRSTSDAAELLDKEADIVIGFDYFEEDLADGHRATKMVVSTRSHTTYDCSALAKFYGGGGHTKAAGFSVEVKVNDPNPYNAVEALITAYELGQR